jgi:mannose-1-phosphate guanylyltransferase
MFAVILAGGAGTRLRPLTYARRKELVPLLNRPLLEYRLLNLKQHGVSDIVIACSQGMREIEEQFGDGSALSVNLRYSYEDRPLGSGRAVKEAARSVGATGTLVVCNGDILTNVALGAMIDQHRRTDATLSISLAAVDDPWHFGVVAVDEELRISRFVEKPPQGEQPSDLINAGTWLWEPEVLTRIPDDESAIRDGFSERALFPGIIDDGLRVQGFEEDLWVDVGAPDRYLRANALLLERTTQQIGEDVVVLEGADVHDSVVFVGHVLIAGGARIESGARIVGPTVIGSGTHVGADADIVASIIWEGARIGAGASITGSIIAAGVIVGEGASMADAILANGAKVVAGATLNRGTSVMPGESAG